MTQKPEPPKKYDEPHVMQELVQKLNISLDLHTVMERSIDAIKKLLPELNILYVITSIESTESSMNIYTHCSGSISTQYLDTIRDDMRRAVNELSDTDPKRRAKLEELLKTEYYLIECEISETSQNIPDLLLTLPIYISGKATGLINFSSSSIKNLREHELYIVRTIIHNMEQTLGRIKALIDRENYRIKSEFSSVFAHELKSPLITIDLIVEALKTGNIESLNEEQVEYISQISRANKREMQIVNDLLMMTKAETESIQMKKKAIDIEKLIHEVIDETSPLAQAKECIIDFVRPEKKIPDVLIDTSLLKHVVYNLLTNAIRYSFENNCGRIALILEQDEYGHFMIKVSNKGIGIPPEDQSKIFKKFFRAKNATKAEAQGTGLGLYVIKMIVELMDGTIEFDSQPGDDTIFMVRLPLK